MWRPQVADRDDDDEYAKLIRKMNLPRVIIDNNASDDATVIQVNSVNENGILLQVVQVLIDLNLIITKAYISSDGKWFMDVFNVTDRNGNKLRDEKIISYIQTSLESDACFLSSLRESSAGVKPSNIGYTSIELTGTDRPGLLSEICSVLTDFKCNVVKAELWTHNTRVASVVHVTDESTRSAIEDAERLSTIKELLRNVLEGDDDSRRAKMTVSTGSTHTARRLHQMMFDERDYERVGVVEEGDKKSRPQVAVVDCKEKDYTIIILRSKDRPKLLFDTVCTLTEMQYVVFHGTVAPGNGETYQEYCIRHIDGHRVNSDAERDRLVQCLQAAIQRRASEGLELELRTGDRVGLLSDITRAFRENGLCITRAEISTEDAKAVDTFYVSEVSGSPVDAKTIDLIRRQVGQMFLRVKQEPFPSKPSEATSAIGFLLGNFLKRRR
ncbi:ACT domain-containing protein ACR6-like [Phoenix dactylifera]|uniref:ACT domain-containing protein ACR n=1 Tax=Phoenix dactylifera TaxID=42345 RepID=A0A8B7C3H1_PHODC|nr:ACT domain-containing protein ACR6-like [Phoenix dactylifera]